jgi:lysyl-tRNA synthetase class 2
MKPEKVVPQIELGEDENIILDILNSQEEAFSLAEVKEKSKLSGKKWDKASKTLTKNNLVKVEKIDENVWMKLA